jgi:putative salt-induced outer membrane protein YdiY
MVALSSYQITYITIPYKVFITMKIFRFSILFLSLLAIASMSVGAADNAQGMSSLSNASSISDGEELGRWWLKSAKKYNPLPNPFLYHFEGSYSYSESSGNIEAESHTGNLKLTLRKQLVTSFTEYNIGNYETTKQLVGKEIVIKEQRFLQAFRLALTEKLEAVVGGFWARSTSKYLQDRFVYYGGARFMVIDTPNLDLMLGGYYGDTETEFMNHEIQNKFKYQDFPPVDNYDSDVIYLSQKLHWKITPTVSFTGTGDYMRMLENTDYYFWNLKSALNFKLSKNFSFVTSYTISYDFNPFTEAVQNYLDRRRVTEAATTGDIYRRDTALSFGIKLTF